MALVLSTELDQDATRILQSQNAFEVLKLKPTAFISNDEVVKAYETLVAPFRKLIRNRLAIQAKARLDDAKMMLCNPDLRRKELDKFFEVHAVVHAERAELQALEARTRLLEARCQEVTAARATHCGSST